MVGRQRISGKWAKFVFVLDQVMYKSFVLINLFIIAIILCIVQMPSQMSSEWPEAFKYFINWERIKIKSQEKFINFCFKLLFINIKSFKNYFWRYCERENKHTLMAVAQKFKL